MFAVLAMVQRILNTLVRWLILLEVPSSVQCGHGVANVKSEPVMICYMRNLNIFIDHRGLRNEARNEKQINNWIDRHRLNIFIERLWIELGTISYSFTRKSNGFDNWNFEFQTHGFESFIRSNILSGSTVTKRVPMTINSHLLNKQPRLDSLS